MNEGFSQKGILLETGTNEFEIIEFTVGKVHYGINVAKVREVINPVTVTKMPHSHPYVDGVFTLRGRVMPLVNLPRVLDCQQDSAGQNIIVSELNNFYVGFLVNEVSRIHRISWTAMEPPPSITNSDMVVGIIKMDEKIIVLLDFEKIVADINPDMNLKLTSISQSTPDLDQMRHSKTILIAEDSIMLRELLVNTLQSSGYANVKAYNNGKEAWEGLQALISDGTPVENKVQLVITDIEMPQMDGHHLIKRIKADRHLQILPTIIFSSLINEEMRQKGLVIGADGQISKPEIGQLIELIDKKIL